MSSTEAHGGAPSPIGEIVRRLAARVPEHLRDLADEAVGLLDGESADEKRERQDRQRAGRTAVWRNRLPAMYEGATLQGLHAAQDPGGRVSGWLDRADSLTLVLVGPADRGKCVTGDALVTDPITGRRLRLDEAVRSEMASIHSADEDGTRVSPIGAHIDSGVKPVVRLTLASGKTVKVTGHHKMLLPDGWREASEITPGETVASPMRLPLPLAPVDLSDAEIDLLALLLTEGACTGSSIRFATGDPVMLERAQAAAATLGMSIRHLGRYDYVLNGIRSLPEVAVGKCACACGQDTDVAPKTSARHGYIAGEPYRYRRGHHPRQGIAMRLVRDHGLDCLAKHKRVPAAVFGFGETALARFLSVCWMADGTVGADGRPEFTVASEGLATDMQHLLLRLGVQSSVRYKAARLDGRSFDSWRVTVPAASRPLFAKMLDLWGVKAERAALPTVPLAHNVAGRARPTRPSDLAVSTSPHLWWDKVLKVDALEPEQVYDLSVPGPECFVAQDLVVHNTHAAYAVGAEALRRGRTVVAYTLADLNAAMRPDGDPLAYDRATTYEYLLLDDLGREQVTPWSLEQVQRILDHRTRERLHTIVTTNLTATEIEERYGSPVIGRLTYTATIVKIEGPSLRKPAAW